MRFGLFAFNKLKLFLNAKKGKQLLNHESENKQLQSAGM